MSELKINSNNGFLQMEDLPQNCIFNKVVTGCGGTTIALFNEINYIIAVPTTELITNKTGLTEAGEAIITSPDKKKKLSAFGLFGTFSNGVKKQLKEYVASSGIKKILCTYDKIVQLVKFIAPQEYQLLVDEYHQLLKACSYRKTAINGVLENFKKFKSFCFLSATPISPDFTPTVLNEIEQVDAVWSSTDTMIVSLEQTNNPYTKVANIINHYKQHGYLQVDNHKSYEAFFFINSVTDIAEILKHCKLTNDEVKIVCANNETNRTKLNGYTISNSRTKNKMFTFITSKSFEGADYFSDTGLCFVVSNSKKKNTLLDISTDIYQIAGRIRTENNPFRNKLVHIFNTTGKRKLYLDITYEEFKQVVDEKIEAGKAFIEVANTTGRQMAREMINSEYIMQDENGNYVLNDMVIRLDLMNYKIEQQIYRTGVQLKKSYDTNGTLTTEINYEALGQSITKASKKLSFKEAFLRYAELKQSYDFTNETEQIAQIQPLVVDAYKKLGEDKVRKLRYNKTAIQKELAEVDTNKPKEEQAKEIIMQTVTYPNTYTCAELQSIISEAYYIAGIHSSVKASHITKWFECKKTTQRINGISTTVYKIFTPKITLL